MALPNYKGLDEYARHLEFERWFRENAVQHERWVHFMSCVRTYDIDQIHQRYEGLGELVNLSDWHNQATALHYAAADGAREIVLWLCQQPEIDHLVQDRFGRLPSLLAYEVAGDTAIGRYLVVKEHKQAQIHGVDVLALVSSD
ncbi:MAG: hypothetical protein RIA64_08860 [Rhodospirillales bacterium]